MMDVVTSFVNLIPVTIAQSLLYGFVALGIMIPFRLLSFPDLTCEGSFPLGGCLCGEHHVDESLPVGVRSPPPFRHRDVRMSTRFQASHDASDELGIRDATPHAVVATALLRIFEPVEAA